MVQDTFRLLEASGVGMGVDQGDISPASGLATLKNLKRNRKKYK